MKTTLLRVISALALFAIFVYAAGCGGGTTSTESSRSGGIAMKVVWRTSNGLAAEVPTSVVTVRMAVSGPGMTTLQQDFPASSRSGTITSVPPGSGMTVTLSGLDASGAVTHVGAASNVLVQADVTTDVGVIVMEPVAPATYTLSGITQTDAGTVIPGVTVNLTGAASLTTSSGADGSFSFTVPNGSYTVTGEKAGYTFSPVNVTVNGASVTTANLIATVTSYSISGRVTSNNAPLSGVAVALSGGGTGSATTDGNGYYTLSGLANGNYTLTPTLQGYTFTPSSLAVTLAGASLSNQDFVAFIGHTGQVQVNLQWSDCSDLDLYVDDPCQDVIYFGNRSATCQGRTGTLDVDANVSFCSANPAENIYWEVSPSGSFQVQVNLYSRRVTGPIPYTVTTRINGVLTQYPGSFSTNEGSGTTHTVTVFTN